MREDLGKEVRRQDKATLETHPCSVCPALAVSEDRPSERDMRAGVRHSGSGSGNGGTVLLSVEMRQASPISVVSPVSSGQSRVSLVTLVRTADFGTCELRGLNRSSGRAALPRAMDQRVSAWAVATAEDEESTCGGQEVSSKKLAKLAARLSESGDRDLWPKLVQMYHNVPGARHIILWHLPHFWAEHEDLVVPLIAEALQRPEDALVALHAASKFPQLQDAVVAALRRSEVRRQCDEEEIVGILGCIFGLVGDPCEVYDLTPEEYRRLVRDLKTGWKEKYGRDLSLQVERISNVLG